MNNVLLFLATIIISAHVQAEIIDGENVNQLDHPEVFGLKLNSQDSDNNESEAVCTSFLVTPNLLLTAAHCLQNTSSISLIANGSNLNIRQKGLEVESDHFESHPKFELPTNGMSQLDRQKNVANDIGYILLRQPVVGITPLPVYVSKDAPSKMLLNHAEVTLVGYGASRFIGIHGDYSNQNLLIKKQGKKEISSVLSNYILLSGEAYGALPGDSGGPEMVNINGITQVAAINHGMQGLAGNDREYGSTIGTLLTPENLCWVVSSSKVQIPGVDCSKK